MDTAILSLRRVRAVAVALAVGAGLVITGASPAQARPIPPAPTVDVGSVARLSPDGQTVDVDISASCPRRWTVLEALVTVSQPQAFGQSGFPLTCTGGLQLFTVTVRSFDAPFELGTAQASAFVLIQRGRTLQAQDSQVVRVVPNVSVDLADTGTVDAGGQAVLIDVTTACPVGAAGQPSNVHIGQGPAVGGGVFVPVCNGLANTATVTVSAFQGLFHPGTAQATALVYVGFGGDVFIGEDTHLIQLG